MDFDFPSTDAATLPHDSNDVLVIQQNHAEWQPIDTAQVLATDPNTPTSLFDNQFFGSRLIAVKGIFRVVSNRNLRHGSQQLEPKSMLRKRYRTLVESGPHARLPWAQKISS